MKWFEKLAERLEKDVSFRALAKGILILVIVWLFRSTDVVWKGLFQRLWTIFEPFVLGFIVAFVLRPLIRRCEQKKISRKAVIPVVYILILILFLWMLFTLVPMIFSRLGDLITSAVSGLQWLYDAYAKNTLTGAPNWLQQVVSTLVSALNDVKNITPDLSRNLTKMLNQTLAVFTKTLFTLIVSIYICSEWEVLTEDIVYVAARIHPDLPLYLHAIGDQAGDYVRSLLILMVIKFGEYALLYSLVGHHDWLVLATLTALGLIVPYIGPMFANVVGLVTGLALLPRDRLLILLVMIVLLSNVDAYLIEPMVHAHNMKISALWALFSIYAGGALGGAVGVMLGIPVYLSVLAVIRIHGERQHAGQGPASVV